MSPQEKKAVKLLRKLKKEYLPFSDDLNQFLADYDKHLKEQKRVARYADAASANYFDLAAKRGEEIDLDDREWLSVSKGDDAGAWVSAWVWVSDENVKEWRKDVRKVKKIEEAQTETRGG